MAHDLLSGRRKATLGSPIGPEVLGLVIQRPSYGYELVQRFQRIFGDLIALSSVARIYNALEALNGLGLVEEIPVTHHEPSTTRQPKYHYKATPLGVQTYEEWLVARTGEEHRRSWLFAHQLAMLEPEAALEVLDRCETDCLDEADQAEIRSPEQAPRTIADKLSGVDERLAIQLRLTWISYARTELESLMREREEGS